MKRCARCGQDRPAHDFHKDRGRKDGLYAYCKPCVKRIRVKRPQKHDPERKRNEHLQRRYGLTREQYDQMLTDQNGRCAICEEPMHQPCVDHDHASGRVRGLLCHDCNLMLGKSKDNTHTLRQAAVYLEGHTHNVARS